MKQKKEMDITALKFLNLNINFIQRNYDLKIIMKLESLRIDDFVHQPKKYILTSNLDQNSKSKIIAQFNYLHTSKKSDIYKKEASNYLIAHFQAVQIYFDPVTLAKIVEFGYDVYNSLTKTFIRPKIFVAYTKKEINEKGKCITKHERNGNNSSFVCVFRSNKRNYHATFTTEIWIPDQIKKYLKRSIKKNIIN